jgi:hypothetical protein
MKQPSTLYVGQILREKKLFQSKLNDKNPRQWKDLDYKEWASIIGENYTCKAKEPKRKMYVKNGRTRAIRVMRMSDGKMFASVTECIEKEGFYKVLMEHLLSEGITYKRIKE